MFRFNRSENVTSMMSRPKSILQRPSHIGAPWISELEDCLLFWSPTGALMQRCTRMKLACLIPRNSEMINEVGHARFLYNIYFLPLLTLRQSTLENGYCAGSLPRWSTQKPNVMKNIAQISPRKARKLNGSTRIGHL